MARAVLIALLIVGCRAETAGADDIAFELELPDDGSEPDVAALSQRFCAEHAPETRGADRAACHAQMQEQIRQQYELAMNASGDVPSSGGGGTKIWRSITTCSAGTSVFTDARSRASADFTPTTSLAWLT